MLKSGCLIAVLVLLGFSVSKVAIGAEMSSYCQVPPYAVQNVTPNILIILDTSASMNSFAYQDGFHSPTAAVNSCTTRSAPCYRYNYVGRPASHRYYGYFDPNQWYTYSNNVFQPHSVIVPGAQKPSNTWSGDLLNWMTMRRIDIMRRILTGGTLSGDTISGYMYSSAYGLYRGIVAEEARLLTPYDFGDDLRFDFSTTTGISSFNVVRVPRGITSGSTVSTAVASGIKVTVKAPVPLEGVLQNVVGARARIGLMFYNSDSQGGKVVVNVGDSSLSAAISQINNTASTTTTPLAESLWSAVGYFARQNRTVLNHTGSSAYGPLYHNNDYDYTSPGSDPMNLGAAGLPRYPVCQKNFILLMTDGEPVSDGSIPVSLREYSNGKSQFNCTGSSCPAKSGPGYSFPAASPGVSYLEDVALFMHTNDLREDISGFQNLTLYTVFAFGKGSTLLKYASINGGFERYGPGDMPSSTPPYNWDKNGDGIPDTYFEATDGAELEHGVRNAFIGILRRASSGTAASVLASGEGSGANLIQALYYPRRAMGNDIIAWTGVLQNMWYYVDPFFSNSTVYEDTTADSVLDFSNDYIIKFHYDPIMEQTSVRRWKSDAKGNTLEEQAPVSVEDISSLWEAGKKLWQRDLSKNPRNIKTSLDGLAFMNFSAANASVLAPYMLETGDNVVTTINYVAGIDNADDLTLRSRTATVGTYSAPWRLGDVINSTPRIVAGVPLCKYDSTYSDFTYKSFIEKPTYKNRGMVFAGGNDGMMHAFRLGKLELLWEGKTSSQKARLVDLSSGALMLGGEAWAFIPKNALPYLKYLKDPDYCHLYYVDLTPYIFDASIGGSASDPRTVDSWRTVLIGGMRTGGACGKDSKCTPENNCVRTPDGADVGYSSYFALDVTDPENPSLLWEFAHPNLGFATTGPAVVRVNARSTPISSRDISSNGEWYVVFGSGPTGPIDSISSQFKGRSNQELRFFVLDLKTGALVQTIDTGIENAFAGSMLNTVADFNSDYQDDVIYVGYIKKESEPGTIWNDGGVGRIVVDTAINPNGPVEWKFSKVIDGIGPVTSAITRLQNRNLSTNWLFFGTGRYFYEIPAMGNEGVSEVDDGSAQRRLFGLKEPCFTSSNMINSSCTTTLSINSRFVDVTSAANAPQESEANSSGINGWYINLDGDGSYTYDGITRPYRSERVITDPLSTTSGLVYFTTFKPYNDDCALGGKSFLWAVRYNTGGTPTSAALNSKAVIQLSTAGVEQIDLSSAFNDPALNKEGRRSAAIEGVPPYAQGLSLLTPPLPVKRIMHITER